MEDNKSAGVPDWNGQVLSGKKKEIFFVPYLTRPHVCRHTFCSNMAKSGMNPKALQYIMGHSDISVTLNTYTHIKAEEAREEMERIKKEQKKSVAVGRKIVKIS